MCETNDAMRLAFLFAALVPLALVACAAPAEDGPTSADESNLDTSGCSGNDRVEQRGPVQVNASRPPTTRCWNIDTAGYTLTYSWSQTDNAEPQWKSVGFWTSVNGEGTFVPADAHECKRATTFGLGHDTSGTQRYTCTARRTVKFNTDPLKAASYGSDGRRLPWEIQVAVTRDDGSWDSLDGANYRFSL